MDLLIIAPICAIIGLLFAGYFFFQHEKRGYWVLN